MPNQRRRFLNIGPGLIVAILLSVFVVYKYVQVQAQIGRQHQVPPVIERQTVYSSDAEREGPTPEVKFILDRSRELSLSSTQVARLQKLESEWERFSGPKLAQANQAAGRAGDYLSGATDNRRTPSGQIQDHAQPVITLSREISAARRNYWDRAAKLLTPQQRLAVRKAREAYWLARAHRMPTASKRAAD